MSSNKSITRRNFAWNLIGSSFYAFTSLIYLIIVTRINGLNEAGIFTFAFSFVCIIQVVGTYSGRTYQVTDRDKTINDSDYLYFRILNVILMILLTILFVSIKSYTIDKILVFILILAYKVLDAYSETIYGIFQKNNNLYQAGISLTLKSVFTTLVFLITNIMTTNLIYSLIALFVSNLIVFLIYDIRKLILYKIKLYSINIENIKKLVAGGFSVFVFTLLTQYIVNAQKFAIDELLLNNDQAIFGIILMPATLMTLCSQFIINPFLYDMNEFLNKKDYKNFKLLVYKICFAIFAVGIVALIMCYLIGIPILNWLYNIELTDKLIPLLIIVSGSIFYGISAAISNSLIAIRKNNIQLIIYIVVSVVALFTSYFLTSIFGLVGASVAYLITVLLLFLLFMVTFILIIRKASSV